MRRPAEFINIETKDVGEAMYKADHDFTVEMVPLTMPDGSVVYDKQACRRTDTGAYLGTVGNKTQPLQPVDFYDMARELIINTGGSINQVVTMHHGSVIGISFQLGVREYVPGDLTNLNFLMLTSYNSSYAILGRAISNRFVCFNMLPSSQKLFNIKNTVGNQQKLDMAMNMLTYYGKEMQGFDTKMKALTSHRMTGAQAVDWFGKLLPAPLETSKRSQSIHSNTVEKFDTLLWTGIGSDIPGVRGTAYGALQAHTEFCNHHRSTRVKGDRSKEEVRFESSVLGGTSDQLMQKGFSSLLKLAA